MLVIVETKSEFAQAKLERDIAYHLEQDEKIRTPISLIVHDIDFVNRRLKKAQYFFTDIKKEGVLLFDTGKYQLCESRELLPEERKKLAQEDFDYYFKEADEFKELVDFCVSKERFNKAAFLLHQTTERLYTGILLIFTRYKPNTHNLSILRKLSNSLSNQLLDVFPLENDDERWLFKLLCKAYVDARYKPNYKITKEELMCLISKVERLREIGYTICFKKMESFTGQADKNT